VLFGFFYNYFGFIVLSLSPLGSGQNLPLHFTPFSLNYLQTSQ
jgi:hypothetical protein